jgi:hypothetical protein
VPPIRFTREFIGLVLPEAPPDHSTISRTRHDTGESYQDFLTKLAQASGIETPTRADLARIDRKRKKKGSNVDWTHLHDPDAKITKMKDGRTHLAHKAEHAVDLETGAIVGVTVQHADEGDATTSRETLIEAAEQIEAVRPDETVSKRSSATRVITATSRSSIWKPWESGATSPNRIADAVTGRAAQARATRCIAIVGGFAVPAVSGCYGSAASYWNGPLRTCTKPVACAVSTSEDTPTFGNGC